MVTNSIFLARPPEVTMVTEFFFLDVHSKFIFRKETIWIMFNVSVLLSYEIAELFNFKMMAADC